MSCMVGFKALLRLPESLVVSPFPCCGIQASELLYMSSFIASELFWLCFKDSVAVDTPTASTAASSKTPFSSATLPNSNTHGHEQDLQLQAKGI
jgi:hypothetical protein